MVILNQVWDEISTGNWSQTKTNANFQSNIDGLHFLY